VTLKKSYQQEIYHLLVCERIRIFFFAQVAHNLRHFDPDPDNDDLLDHGLDLPQPPDCYATICWI
jgi:hypothetical protein